MTIICSCSMDKNTVKVWLRIHDKFNLIQELSFGDYSLCVGLRLFTIPVTNELLMACATDNSKIHIFIQDDLKVFEQTSVLTGHDDWVRGLDFAVDRHGDILLASGSQDSFIRLWRITYRGVNGNEDAKKDQSKVQIKSAARAYNILLESVLAGHEGWVYSVNWSPNSLQLLSASIDKTMIIWEFDDLLGLWTEKVRVGEVGGNTLGFYGGFFGAAGDSIVAHSYHGAFHIWSKVQNEEWKPSVTIGGHFNEVSDLQWEPNGGFIFSISADQTTRIHVPWSREGKQGTWHELARPQVHGYNMSSLAVFSGYKFASGAEEKVIRVFNAPATFIENLGRLCAMNEGTSNNGSYASNWVPKGASVPSLGLSNKAVYNEDNLNDATPVDKKNPYPEESHFKAQLLTEPPTEETLLQNTLWPETQKLYGHGYEIFALAASPDGKYLASACRATQTQHAAIFIWDTTKWQQTQKLMSHHLTVVQMKFSPDSKRLLSVSRDRRWTIFFRNDENAFELISTTDKNNSIHTRIIWTCAWTHDSQYFATGSRDGKLVVWHENLTMEPSLPLGRYEVACEPLQFVRESVTAVAFGPNFVHAAYLVAVGFDSGEVQVLNWRNFQFTLVLRLSTSDAHHLTVRKLEFRPRFGRAGYKNNNEDNILQLASCSSDTSTYYYHLPQNKNIVFLCLYF
ncbi:elongator complex protein 2 isoform X2 [Cylas formicarius]|nr:elongator complex protein 2 isoform X2 [Cylas formicarius]XP_060527514.1 elongator complex protein 2 isoform X2 [Cylas formicarius]